MKKALVTGGCGFIGSNLAQRLVSDGWHVTIVDDMSNGHLELLEGLNFRVIPDAGLLDTFRDSIKSGNVDMGASPVVVIEDDFANPRVLQSIADGEYDVVFHQAAVPRVSYSVEQPLETTRTNITKTVALFEASRGAVEKIVWASSSSVYGGADILPTTEAEAKDPKSPYAWQKSAIEDVATLFGTLYDLDIVCLRYFNVFGPGQYGDSPYSTAVSAWCNNTKFMKPLRSDGDGTQSRDMCFVDNVVDANVLAANSEMRFMGKCYNVACGDRTSNGEILEYFKSRFSHVVVQEAPWRPGDVMHTQADITSIKKDLGYEPKVRFWEGLEKTIDWWNIN
ncbi:GDP-mannose 4,6-dehydratase [bacterium]|nr:GDP-mannose 4,6-dehydratase [bacterium]